MAYTYTNSKGRTYVLHGKTTQTKSGKDRTLYYFAREEKEGALEQVPAGYQVVESRTGLPVLKKAES
jgi:hypothetical protein